MQSKVINVTALVKSEMVQEPAKVSAIARSMGADASEIAWDETPAIIVDEEGNILDGHHRVAAAIESGLNVWRALTVNRAQWDVQAASAGIVGAGKWAADAADDAVTWGSL